MKRLGLIGGMSWESTAVYYRLLNQGAQARFGGLTSAPLILWSADFAPIAAAQSAGDWPGLGATLAGAARDLVAAGAQGLMLCTNTMHKLFDAVAAAADPVPVLHIADALGAALGAAGCRAPLLIATRYTMEQAFLRDRLAAATGIEARIPNAAGRDLVHGVIYDELCRGVIAPASRDRIVALIDAEAAAGADAVILGCTELGLLLAPGDCCLPLFDTTALHAAAGLDFACG